MEQGRKVSEHATPLARNFYCLGKDVESGNIPQVQINLAASCPFSVMALPFVFTDKKKFQLSETFFSADFELKFSPLGGSTLS